jgi:SAM-dependent methyltransferase
VTGPLRCWCGNTALQPFSPQYRHCPVCETLVLADRPQAPLGQVHDDDRDFYGKRYWFEHQEQDLGLTNLPTRVRQDLPDRCLYWLRTLLTYKVPPAASLELGASHGAFVALLRWAGFDAMGLEMSPWVADFARQTFDIPMLVGPIETQTIEPASLGVVAAMDVVEHLEDPLGTLQHAVRLLRPDAGVLLLQTPCYPAGMSYEAMQAQQSPFLAQLQAPEHVHLLSERAMRLLLERAGIAHVTFLPAIFAHYDMFLVASSSPLREVPAAEVEARLAASASGRLLQAMLDLYANRAVTQRDLAEEAAHVHWLKESIDRLERDRADRLTVLERQGAQLGQISALEADIAHLKGQVYAAEADRTARLEVIERQGHELGRVGALDAEVRHLKQQLETMEEARAAQLAIIQLQRQELAKISGEREAQQSRLSSLQAGLASSQQRGAELERRLADALQSRLTRLLRKLSVFR